MNQLNSLFTANRLSLNMQNAELVNFPASRLTLTPNSYAQQAPLLGLILNSNPDNISTKLQVN